MTQHLQNNIPGYKTFLEVLRSRASDRPDECVFTFESYAGGTSRSASLTFRGLERRALALGATLQALGLEGERAVLVYPPGLEFISAFFGCLAAGVLAVPAPAPRPNRPPERLRAILDDARPRALLTTASLAAERTRWSAAVPRCDALTWLTSDQVAADEEQERALAGGWRDPGLSARTLAFLQYTSGSTSAPRGVMISHGSLLHNSALIQRTFRSTPESRGVFWLPLYHDMGLIGGVLQTIYCGGASTLFSPVAFLQEPVRWLEAISATRATISGGPNFAYDLCARKLEAGQCARLDLSSWTVAFNGAEPVRAETLDRFAALFAPCGFRREAFLPCYGLAEATLMVSGRSEMAPPVVLPVAAAALEQNRIEAAPAPPPAAEATAGPQTRRLVGSGRVAAGLDVVIVDPATGIRSPAGTVGEIWVSGPSVAAGYWDQPELSAECFAATLAETTEQTAGAAQFLRTGDLGFMADGELFVTGRLKDLLIIGGRNVYPQDIEGTVERCHPLLRVDSGAAVAVEEAGEERLVVVHEVERQARADRVEEIAAAVRAAVAAEHELEVYAVVLIKVASIPRTSSGKVRRQACRAGFLEGTLEVVGVSIPSAPAAHPLAAPAEEAPATAQAPLPLVLPRTAGEIEAWLIERLAGALGVQPAALDSRRPFVQLGLGSLRAVRLAGELQERLGRPLSPTLFYEYPTVADLARFLAGDAGASAPGDTDQPVTDGGAQADRSAIAIIGIGCRFPGASGPDAFWTLLREGRDAVGELPLPRRGSTRLGPSARGGFLDRVDLFDAGFFGLAPREVVPMDPQQRLLLETAWEALEDAGQAPERLAGSATGVFIGIAANDYAGLAVPDDQPGEVYQITGNALSIAANRVSYVFDFRGPSLAIDTACSSSMVAVHLACQSLRSGESTLALAGGVNVILGPEIEECFRRAGMLSPDGCCKTFDARADGYVRGEGAGVVVLKPLHRAVAEGDPIYAVIRGSAVNQDGRTNGLTAPSRQSQEAVLRAAYRQAGIAPGRVSYVEAHGTGTFLGDPIEAKALGAVLAEGRPEGRRCLVGSVKTNVGHLEAAAGVAGLIKTALALKHQAIPAHLHFGQANPEIPLDELRLDVPRALVSLADAGVGTETHPFIAGVSSFGFGGTNAHVVLEGLAQPAQGTELPASDGDGDGGGAAYVLTISARRPEALKAQARAYRDALAQGLTGVGPATIAASAAARRGHHEYRIALVGCCRPEWIALLDIFERGEAHPDLFAGRALAGRHPEHTAGSVDSPFRLDRDGKIIPRFSPAGEESRTTSRLLAKLYTEGAAIAWDELKRSSGFVSLPPYPWQRERFWWETGRPGAGPGSCSPRPPDEAVPPPVVDRAAPPDLALLRSLNLADRRARLVPYMQERLAAVLLSTPAAIDPEQPLDACGIDSLMAMDLKLEIEKDLAVSIPLTSLLVGPTLNELGDEVASRIDAVALGSAETVASMALPAAGEDLEADFDSHTVAGFVDHPLSYGQQSLWSLHQLAPESAAYHMAGAARVPRAIDAGVLARCFQVLNDRHAALRTTFPGQDGRPVQRVHDAGTVRVDFATEDLGDIDIDPADEAGLMQRLAAEARRPFDLALGPLFRVRLFRQAHAEPILLLVFHHIVGDFWSIAVLLEELGRLYPALRSGRDAGLAPLPLQAADFARRQAVRIAGVEGERLWAYWEKQLAGALPALDLPRDRPRPAVQTDRGARRSLLIDPSLTERLGALGRARGASLYTTLLAALQVLLHRVTGQDDVIVGSPVAGRSQPGCAGVVGYFVNTLPMRGDLAGDPAFTAFLDRVRTAVHEALEHQDFPFPLMVERLNLPRDPGRTPVFQVLFVFQKSQQGATRELTALTLPEAGPGFDLGGLALKLVPLELDIAQFDLTLVAAEQDGRLALGVEYNTDLFDAATIDRFLAQLRTLLEAIACTPDRPISALEVVPPDEQQWLLAAAAGPAPHDEALGVDSITRLFELQADETPDALAVVFGAHALCYAALNARANRLARHLRLLGVGAETRVGLCAERSLEMVVAILGILKAGGAYVPLDPGYPTERLDFLIADSRIGILLTQEALSGRFAGKVGRVVCLDTGSDAQAIAFQGESNLNLASATADEALAYVIYTSGSTGKPKGVMVSQRNLVASTLARRQFYHEPLTGFLLLSSFAFDSSVAGIFGTLCQGGTLVLPPPGAEHDPALLAARIASERVSHLLCVPSLYEVLLAEAPAAQLACLRVAIVAGEGCRGSLAERHRAVLPQAALVNEYGPTEATVWCTAHRCEPDGDSLPKGTEATLRSLVPIGRPIAGARIHVLDAHLGLVPIGVAGELFVGGPGVARGYLGRPALTAARFIPDPFGEAPGSRLYRTGDLARWRGDGTLEFLGRIDDQVKVRGFRIELGEVEAALGQHPAVREAAVAAREDVAGSSRLAAYVTLHPSLTDKGEGFLGEWRQWLRVRLPEYMVPSALVILDRLPLSPNGKLDRKALPVPAAADMAARTEYIAPRDPVEELLVRVTAEVLRCDRLGVNDNLFDLGVDSILSIQIAARVRQAGLELSPALLFQSPTIAEIAALINTPAPPGEDAEPLAPGPLPLTTRQRWLLEQELPAPQHAVEALWLELAGTPDRSRLARVVEQLAARHEALRVRFTRDESGWVQAPGAEGPSDCFVHFDVSVLAGADQQAAIGALAEGIKRSLDLARGPLLRVALFDRGADRGGRLLVVVHQLAIDRASWRILLEDMATIDEADSGGELVLLAAATCSSGRWTEGNSDAADEVADDHLPVGLLPLDFAQDRDPGTVAEAATVTIALDEKETRALLEEVPLAYNTALEDALLTALAEALARWTGQECVLVDIERDARTMHGPLARTVGGLTTFCPAFLELPTDPGAAAALKAIKEQLRRLPLSELGQGLPGAEVLFRLSSDLEAALPPGCGFALPGDAPLPERAGCTRRPHLLEVEACLTRGRLTVRWTYRPDRHRGDTISSLAEEFLAAIRALIAHCQSPAARGYTPSDFPLAGLDQRTLDQLMFLVEDGAEEGLE